jgi:glycosyltransferase involved in cell wall biosynthesis
MVRLIDEWISRDPEVTPLLVMPSKRGALAAEVRKRQWRAMYLPYEGWALFSDPGGRPERVQRLYRDFAALRRLIEVMRSDPPELVITNTLVAPWGALAAAAVGIPHVWFVREFGETADGFRYPDGREEALTDIGLLSGQVVANSRAVREALLPFIPEEKISVAYPLVDADGIRSAANHPLEGSPFPYPNPDLRVVVVGRVTASKGQWRVVEAAGILARRGIHIAVSFVGAIVQSEADGLLKARARALGIADHIVFFGERDNPFPAVLAADVGIVSSDREAFGRVVLEYLILGKPVIAPRTGGSAELVEDGRSGYLIDPDSIEELADRLIRYSTDPDLRERHGAAALDRAEEIIRASDPGATFDMLASVVERGAVRLPMTVVRWLDAPQLISPTVPRLLAPWVSSRHLRRRLLHALRDPRGTLKRRAARRRRLRDSRRGH